LDRPDLTFTFAPSTQAPVLPLSRGDFLLAG
jgi:hypothetical protein